MDEIKELQASVQNDVDAHPKFGLRGLFASAHKVSLSKGGENEVYVRVKEFPPHDHDENPSRAAIDFAVARCEAHYDRGEVIADPQMRSAEDVQGAAYPMPGGFI